MRIGFELQQLVPGAGGGLSPFLQGHLRALFEGWPQHEVVLFCTEANAPLFRPCPPQVQIVCPPPAAYDVFLDAYAARQGLDVLYRSYPAELDLLYPSDRQVVLIPDIQHEFWPEFFSTEVLRSRRAGFSKALWKAGAITTLSEHARKTLLEQPNVQCEIVVTTPALPSEAERAPSPDALSADEKAALPAPGLDYFFYPANLWPHKNHRRVLQAFQCFLQRAARPYEFIFTGHPEGWPDLAREFSGLPIRHLGFVRRPMLHALMGRARALVFFSLFEGFGIPLLEAFQAGVPVACSDTTSLPEVGGDAVLACDPTDVAAMSAALARLAQDADLRTRLAPRGKKRLACYRWADSAAALVAVLERVASRAATTANAGEAFSRLERRLNELEADREARLGVIRHMESLNGSAAGMAKALARRLWGPARRLARGAAWPFRRSA
jgi:glycosyltransferase involved in cell wall biosynthesis